MLSSRFYLSRAGRISPGCSLGQRPRRLLSFICHETAERRCACGASWPARGLHRPHANRCISCALSPPVRARQRGSRPPVSADRRKRAGPISIGFDRVAFSPRDNADAFVRERNRGIPTNRVRVIWVCARVPTRSPARETSPPRHFASSS